jgi:tetratricopeptide (TPR) repeat protein
MKRSVLVLIMLMSAALADPSPEAVRLYQDGQAAYDGGRYADAIAAWEQSYAVSRAPGLLFNLAQARRLRGAPGDCERALAEYRQYAELTPPSPQTKLAAEYLAAGCPQQSAAPAGPAPGDHGHSLRLSGEVVAGGGVAVLAAGLYFGHHAGSLGDDVTTACASGCSWAAERSTDSAGRRDATIGRVLDVIGGAAIVAGGALYYFGVPAEHVGVVVSGNGSRSISLTWSGAW